MQGFRQFANDINSKQRGMGVPTFDNFRKDFKTGGRNTKFHNSISMGIGDRRNETFAHDFKATIQESAQWEKYFFDLQQKVKQQRENIKQTDINQEKKRQRSFDQMIEMRLQHKIQYSKMVEYQKSMINNVLPKTERLYQRILEKEKQELNKKNKRLKSIMSINYSRTSMGSGAVKGTGQHTPYSKEIIVDESENSSSRNNSARIENGNSRKSKRSDMEPIVNYGGNRSATNA